MTSPHITSKKTTRILMLDVLIALIPAVVCAVVFFGITALITVILCAAACVIAELAFCIIRNGGAPFTITCSAPNIDGIKPSPK